VRDRRTMDDRTECAPPEELLGPLTEIEKRAAPEVLYLQGDQDLLKSGPRVSVVGSRRASREALGWAKEITKMLVEHGITVVSGLALGIDTVAHETAIRAGGRTVAVLGTSLDQCAVLSNRLLQDQIGERHLLVSQFPTGSGFHRSYFPRRNKTMALLSDATVIVEATENSGTRHQGWEAIKLARPVLFPTRFLEVTNARWPQQMVEYGAFGFNYRTLPLVLADLPHRSAEPAVF